MVFSVRLPIVVVDIGLTYQLAGQDDALLSRPCVQQSGKYRRILDSPSIQSVRHQERRLLPIGSPTFTTSSTPFSNYLTGRQLNVRLIVDFKSE